MLKPQQGVTLKIDGIVISDEVRVTVHSQSSVAAWVWNPESRTDEIGVIHEIGPERVGRLTKVVENSGRLEGVNDKGEQETWEISAGRGCVGCN